MLPEWKARAGTTYSDLSYYDILIHAQSKGLVWDGKNPRRNEDFEHGPLYAGPDDDTLQGRFINSQEELDVLTNNHNLIASTDHDNDQALGDLTKLITR